MRKERGGGRSSCSHFRIELYKTQTPEVQCQMSFRLCSLTVINLTLLFSIVAVLIAFRASSLWKDSVFTFKQNGSDILPFDSPMLTIAASISATTVMASQTPVFLYVLSPSPMT